jgi:hypothetical protein
MFVAMRAPTMNPTTIPLLTTLMLVSASARGQSPLLRLQPTARAGQPLQSLLLASPAQPFLTLLSPGGGPNSVLGETLWLALQPAPLTLDAGVLDVIGARTLTIPTPAGAALVGQPLFAQSLVFDSRAPNGFLRASNGASALLHANTAAIVFEFRDAVAEGVTGSFDQSVRERLMAPPIVRRTQTVEPASGMPFSLGIVTPLRPTNARLQHVYRAVDLGGTGQPEVVTALRWKPFGPVVADSFARVHISLAHSNVVPDYTIDPFSQLPAFPNSGLRLPFASNVRAQETPVVVCDTPYPIQPGALRTDGYLPWPALNGMFVYNGVDSLLIDYRVVAGPAALGANGFAVRLMVTTAAEPYTRVFAPGNLQPGIDPFAVTVAQQGDNTLYDLQVDLVRAHATAFTRFVRNPGPMRQVRTHFLAAAVPAGSSVSLRFQGADTESGLNLTGLVPQASFVSGSPFVRVAVDFVANPFTGERPSVDTIVIPVD